MSEEMIRGLLGPWLGPFIMFALFAPGFYLAKHWNDKYPDSRVKRFFLWRPKNIWQALGVVFIPNIFMLAMTFYFQWNGMKWF